MGVIEVGQRFLLARELCRVMRMTNDSGWFIESLSDGRIWEETTEGLLEKWQAGELRFPSGSGDSVPNAAQQNAYKEAAVDAFIQSQPAHVIERAKAKLVFVKRLKHVPITAITMAPLIEETWSDKILWKDGCLFSQPPHFTTVARWIRDYRGADDDIRALADRHHDKGSKESRHSHEVEELADDIVETLYLTLERPSIKTCLNTLQGRVARLNQTRLASEKLPRPQYKYLKRKIKNLPAYDVCVARYGKRAADIRFRASGSGMPVEAPLQRAAIDHCRLDLIVVDDESGLPLGRPWLTLILDEYTRYVLGYYIGFVEPSTVSVAQALRNAVMPKTELIKRYTGIRNTWDAWGTVHTLIADNGLEFHGSALETAMDSFGMHVQFCPRRKPWYKGKIERFFGTLNTGLLAGMPGRTFSNVLEKGEYDPIKHAVVGLETLRQVLLMWVVDVYHQAPHRALETSPAKAWDEAITHTDRWLPDSSLVFDSAFSKREQRKLTHKGIEYDGLLYNSSDMRLLREQHGDTINVEVRVLDEELGHLFVVAPDGRTIIKVPALRAGYAVGMNRWQHKVCRRFQRRMQNDEQLDISLEDAKERIRRLISDDARRGKRVTRKRQSRFTEQADGSLQIMVPSPLPNRTETSHDNRPTRSDGGVERLPFLEDLVEVDEVPKIPSHRISV